MINLTSYILEKFKIHKGNSSTSSLSSIETLMADYLDRMIITDEEKYIKNEIIKAIKDSCLKDIKEDEAIYCYYYHDISKFKETAKELKDTVNLIFLTPPIYKKLWEIIRKFTTKSVDDENTIYSKRMKNQFVHISLKEDNNMLFYEDSFTKILFTTKNYENS